MFNVLTEMLSYTFIIRAIIVGGLVALCSSLLGVSLVLKRYSMIGDGLSHVAFGALTVAMALNLVALAIGVISISLAKGVNTDVFSYMFGSILAMNSTDVVISIALSIVVLVLVILFYNKIFAVTFDENYAMATGTNSNLYNMIIAFLTAITIVIGMRIMGTMLISSLIIFPALTSMRVCKTFKSVMISSAIISVICLLLGIIISYVYAIPTGASIVMVNAIMFVIFFVVGKVLNKV